MCTMFPLAMQHDDHVFTWLLACPDAALAYESALWADCLDAMAALLAGLA